MPCAIRYPKDITLSEDEYAIDGKLKPIINTQPFVRMTTIGSSDKKICIIACGVMLHEAYSAAKRFAEGGIAVDLIEAAILSPFDNDILSDINTRSYKLVASVEEGIIKGGFGESISHAITSCPFITIGVENPFIPQMSVARQRECAGIDANGIYNKIAQKLNIL